MHSSPSESRRSALAKLHVHYESRVRYAVGRAGLRLGYWGPIEDIRQEVWTSFARQDAGMLRYYQPERGPLGPFIEKIAYQRALATIQRERRRSDKDALSSTLEDQLEDPQMLRFYAEFVQEDFYDELMVQAEAELDESDRLLLREVYLNGRSCLAVAQEHGINKNTIYKRHERLKTKLKRLAETLDPPTPDPQAPTALAAILALLLARALAAHHPAPPSPWLPVPTFTSSSLDSDH